VKELIVKYSDTTFKVHLGVVNMAKMKGYLSLSVFVVSDLAISLKDESRETASCRNTYLCVVHPKCNRVVVMCNSIDSVIIVLQKPLSRYDNSVIIMSRCFG